jgi:hypothetical protein
MAKRVKVFWTIVKMSFDENYLTEEDESYLTEEEEQQFFTGSIEEVWEACYRVWKSFERVNDFPHGIRRTRYQPNLCKRLGQEFALKYKSDYRFVVEKLKLQDPITLVCAFEILELISWEFYRVEEELPQELINIDIPIPEPVQSEIASERSFKHFKGKTIGEFLPFLIENG